MKLGYRAKCSVLFALGLVGANSVMAASHTTEESFEVASLIIGLSRSITNELNPPATGAERTVTGAVVRTEGNSRVYHIEGKDVFHTGRVLSTFWIRLIKTLNSDDAVVEAVGLNRSSREPAYGRALAEETQRLIEPLLNGLYDIANFPLDHQKIHLEEIVESSSDPLIVEIIGVNNVCDHVDLNRFKLTITRYVERNRPVYETWLEHPISWVADPIPTVPFVPIAPQPIGTPAA